MYNKPLLQCSQVSKSYQEGDIYINILCKINITLQSGEMVAITGNSGSGKSTLLHLLGGLEKPTEGEVIFEGQSLYKLSSTDLSIIRNRKLGFIYQFHHLLSDFTILENVAMPLLIGGMRFSQANKKAQDMITVVGLKKKVYYYPANLSGGERQRIAVARALVNSPALILADEPTGNLDQTNTDSIIELLNNLNNNCGTTFLIVTHDLQFAKKLNRQLEMCNGMLKVIK